MLQSVGNWLLCWVELPDSSKLSLLCVRASEKEVVYVKLSQNDKGEYSGTLLPTKSKPIAEANTETVVKPTSTTENSQSVRVHLSEYEVCLFKTDM